MSALPTEALRTIQSVELEITGTCQLSCTHCCTNSSPQAPAGEMSRADWERVVDEVSDLGLPMVQFIGGEPTLSPDLPSLIDRALDAGLTVEVYSNLTHVRPSLWKVFEREGVSLATSYYSDQAAEHERITRGRGSHGRTLATITEAVRRGIPLRVGIVEVLDGQRVQQAEAQLRHLGVQRITIDRMRKVGRAADADAPSSTTELCGNCFRHHVAISPDGEVSGCVLSRFLATGNVRQHSLTEILGSAQWQQNASRMPSVQPDACSPGDQSCQPGQPACLPKYPNAPLAHGSPALVEAAQ